MNDDILSRITRWYDLAPSDSALFGCSSRLLDAAAAEIRQLRAKVAAVEAMGYEWRWTRSIDEVDENGEQVGAWIRGEIKGCHPPLPSSDERSLRERMVTSVMAGLLANPTQVNQTTDVFAAMAIMIADKAIAAMQEGRTDGGRA